MIIPTRCIVRVSPSALALLAAVGLAACGGRARTGSLADDQPPPRELVSLSSLAPTLITPVFSQYSVCPGGSVGFGVLVTVPNGELMSIPQDMNADSFESAYRPRVTAALAGNQYIDIADFQVEVTGPAQYTSGHYGFGVAGDIATALTGPIQFTVRSRHHPDLAPATAAFPVSFACSHEFGGRGADGENGGYGGGGGGGGEGTPGEPGEGGGPGGPGDGGPVIEVLAAPVRATGAEGWVQVVARMDGEERQYLLAPGARLTVAAMGGNGGAGGAGGEGGPGFDQNFDYERATDGGPGGSGGAGAPGGPGGTIRFIVDPSLDDRIESFLGWSVEGGAGGAGGQGGAGGRGGYFPIEGANGESSDGPEGPAGPDGPPGADGEATVDTRPMQALFAIDAAAVERTIAALADTPERHFDPTVPPYSRSAGGEQPAGATASAAEGGTSATPAEGGGAGTSATPTNAGGGATASSTPNQGGGAQPAGGGAQPAGGGARPGSGTTAPAGGTAAAQPPPEDAARRRLASGRFVIAALRLIDQNDNVVAIVNPNGDIVMQGRVVARFDGGAVIRDGRIVMALERDGTLHIEQRGQLQPMGRIARNGEMSAPDGTGLAISPNGRITSINGRQRTEMRSHFESVPPNARQTAALVVLMASTNLR